MRALLYAFLLVLPGPAAAAAAAAACVWDGPRATLVDEPLFVVSRWEGDAAALLAEGRAVPAPVARFRAWASARTDTDAFALLRRQHELYLRVNPGDAEKVRLVLSRSAGRVVPMSCAELLLFADQQSRFPVQDYTEFLAFTLRKDGRLRVYSISSGARTGSVGGTDRVRPFIEADRAAGWTVEQSLHNHPFNFDNPSGDIGATLVPSGEAGWGDIGAFRRQFADWGMAEAAITNGFDTVHLTPADVARLAAAGERLARRVETPR